MGIQQTLAILLDYLSCDDPVIKTKYANILASFWHKSEGLIIKSVDNDGAGGTDILFSDDNVVNFPGLPGSKPILFITGLLDALNTKVDKAVGKQLSTEDFTSEFKAKLEGLTQYVHPNEHSISEVTGLQDFLTSLQDNKVDKDGGKELTDNNLTDELLAMINASNPLTGSRIIRGGFSILPNRIIRLFIYEYVIADEYFDTPILTDVQLDVGGVQDRADVVAINTSGGAVVKKGIEGDPAPAAVDLATELFVTWRLMKAGATEPEGSTSTAMYNENLGEAGGEWDTSTYTAGAINPDGASNPSSGLKSVTVTNSVKYKSFFVSHSVAKEIDPDGTLQFKMFLENAWSANDRIWMVFYNGTTQIHSKFPTIKTGSYGFDGTLINEHQVVAIPFKDIAFTDTHFTRIQWFFFPEGKNFSFDEIQLFDKTNQPDGGGGGSSQTISRTSQIPINDGKDGDSFYVEDKNIGAAAKSNNYNDLDGKPTIKSVENEYTTWALCIADQANQSINSFQSVIDASGHPTVDNGYAYFEYLGTTNGDDTDYRKLSEEESMDLIAIVNLSQLNNDVGYIKLSDIQTQLVVTASFTLLPIHNGILIIIDSAVGITITVEDTLPPDFTVECFNDNIGTASFLEGSGVIHSPDGLDLEQDKVCTVFKRGSLNRQIIKGEMA